MWYSLCNHIFQELDGVDELASGQKILETKPISRTDREGRREPSDVDGNSRCLHCSEYALRMVGCLFMMVVAT